MKQKINIKHPELAPKVLYMVEINMGGFLHDRIYELKLKGHEEDSIQYWDRTGNFDFTVGDGMLPDAKKVAMTDKVYKKDRVWKFISVEKEKAEQFLLGAKTVLQFMNKTWLKYYKE